jgi:hypothetical protein
VVGRSRYDSKYPCMYIHAYLLLRKIFYRGLSHKIFTHFFSSRMIENIFFYYARRGLVVSSPPATEDMGELMGREIESCQITGRSTEVKFLDRRQSKIVPAWSRLFPRVCVHQVSKAWPRC